MKRLMGIWGLVTLGALAGGWISLSMAGGLSFLLRIASILTLLPGLLVLGCLHLIQGLGYGVYLLGALSNLVLGWGLLWLLARRPVAEGPPIPEMMLARRTFLASSVGVAAGASWLGYGYTHGRVALEVTRLDFPMRDLPPGLDGLRIAMMADWHCGRSVPQDYLHEVMVRCNAEKPDVILLPGDFLSYRRENAALAAELADRLRPGIPGAVFASYGNHDYWSGMPDLPTGLQQAGVQVLTNHALQINARRELTRHEGSGLWIVGTDDLWAGAPDLQAALTGVPEDQPRLVMSHNPDLAEYQREGRVDLMVSGHTHGGQISFPGLGPLILPSRFGQKYASGMVQGPAYPVYVTRGVGTGSVAVRIGVPPELVVFTLRSV